MRSSTLPIASPCHESWDAMSGAATRRFCGVCEKDVHNLSAMGHDEAQALLREKAGQHVCVRYTAEADGTLRFRDLVPRASLTRKIVRTAFAATLLAACTPYGDAPARELGQAVIESIREATVPTPDGGCDYTTGPFTTFHLPPGHVLCKDAGPKDGAEIGPPYAPPQVMPTMGAPPPLPELPPPAVVEPPVEHVKMGEAMAVPEQPTPFEPCDPKPGFAPPPPAIPSPQPRGPLMGDIAAPEREPERELMGKIAPRDE